MLDKIKNMFNKKESDIQTVDKRVEREVKDLKYKLESSERMVALYSEAVTEKEIDECADMCSDCNGTGYLIKDIRILYACRKCLGNGKTYWVDRCLTASKVGEFEEVYRTRIKRNIHALMYELKQEARKLGAVALIEIKPMPNEKLDQTTLNNFNYYGGTKEDDEDKQ